MASDRFDAIVASLRDLLPLTLSNFAPRMPRRVASPSPTPRRRRAAAVPAVEGIPQKTPEPTKASRRSRKSVSSPSPTPTRKRTAAAARKASDKDHGVLKKSVSLSEEEKRLWKLSKMHVKDIENPLSRVTVGATLYGFLLAALMCYWFYIVWRSYVNYLADPSNGLIDTSIMRFGIPIFLVAMLLEFIIDQVWSMGHYRANDSVPGFASGISLELSLMWMSMLGQYVGVVLVVNIPYAWIHEHYAICSLSGTVGFLVMVFLRDFIYYVFHFAAHKVALLWAIHGVHHRANSFNLTTNIYQSIFMRFSTIPFYIGLAFFFPPELFMLIFPMEKIYGFFTHTCMFAKAAYVDAVFVTPSTHRVHHAGAPSKYIDANYGEVFTIWDRIFGTHVDEQEMVSFGHVHSAPGWTWSQVQFETFWGLHAKSMACDNWWDAMKVWLMPPGWDVESSRKEQRYIEYPLSDESPYQRLKYDRDLSWPLTFWAIASMILNIGCGLAALWLHKSWPLLTTATATIFCVSGVMSVGYTYEHDTFAYSLESLRWIVLLYGLPTYLAPLMQWDAVVATSVATVLAMLSLTTLLMWQLPTLSQEELQRESWIIEAGRKDDAILKRAHAKVAQL